MAQPITLVLFVSLLHSCTCTWMDCDLSGINIANGNGTSSFNFEELCDYRTYLTTLGVRVGICAIISLLLILCCPIFFCGRLCNCCGGRGQHPGICCGNSEIDKKYSKGEVIGVKVGQVFAFVLTLIGLIIGLVGSTQTLSAISGSFDSVTGSVDNIDSKITKIVTTLDQTTADLQQVGRDIGEEKEFSDINVPKDVIDDLRSFTSDIQTGVSDAQTSVNEYKKDFGEWGPIVFFSFNSLFVTLALLLALLNLRTCAPYCVLFFLFLVAIFSWLLLFAFATGQVVLHDFCGELQLTVDDPDSSIIGELVKCDSPGGLDMTSVKKEVAKMEITVANKTCSLPDSVADGKFCEAFDCPNPLPTCTSFNQSKAFIQPLRLRKEITKQGRTVELGPNLCPRPTGQPQCTLDECAVDCVKYTLDINGQKEEYDLKPYADAMVRLTTILDRVFLLLHDEIYPLLECKHVFQLLLGGPSDSCQDVSYAVTLMVVGYTLQSTAMLVGIVCCILGTKRWIPLDECKDGMTSQQAYSKL